jgi:two-component system, LytTR family, response regulator LytT
MVDIMTLLVVEEEKNIVEEIRDILGKIDNSIRIVGVTHDIPSVLTWVKKNAMPDLILVNEGVMPDMFDITRQQAKAVVTFSTHSVAYNFEAFRFNMLRPILSKLPGTAELPEQWHSHSPAKNNYRERFLVKQGQRLHSIHISEIAYFFSEGRFIFFKTIDNQKYITEYRIERLETMLNPAKFFRINRSYIVSLSTVKQIHSWFGNRLKLYLEPEAENEIIVSRERMRRFKAWLGK